MATRWPIDADARLLSMGRPAGRSPRRGDLLRPAQLKGLPVVDIGRETEVTRRKGMGYPSRTRPNAAPGLAICGVSGIHGAAPWR
jgi:hypothetical protein